MSESGTCNPLDPSCPAGRDHPRNRQERRALEQWREKRPPLPPEHGSDAKEGSDTWTHFASESYFTFFEMHYVREQLLARWAQGRAALFESPPMAVVRALALARVVFLATCSDRTEIRLRAAGILARYGQEPPDSKQPPASAKVAAANRLLLRLKDFESAAILGDPGDRGPKPDFAEEIYAELLISDGRSPGTIFDDLSGCAQYAALAEFINVILFAWWADDEDIALRACRGVLRLSEPLFRQVGYGKPAVPSIQEMEELAEVRRRNAQGYGPRPSETGADPSTPLPPPPGAQEKNNGKLPPVMDAFPRREAPG